MAAVSDWRVRITPEKKRELGYSAPFLLFLFFGIVPAIDHLPDLTAIGFLLVCAAFVVIDVVTWLVVEVAPRHPGWRRENAVGIAILSLATVVVMLFPHYGSPFYNLYAVSAVIFCSPRESLYKIAGLAYGIDVFMHALGFLLSSNTSLGMTLTSLIALTTNGVFTLVAREGMDRQHDREIASVRAASEAKRQERMQLANDLHDQLGQTLTAINSFAQLSVKMLQSGNAEAAQMRLEGIEDMSRQALAQMRAVVTQRHRLTIAEEIENARNLLEVGGIKPLIDYRPCRFSPAQEDALAHIIREAVTNVLRHSRATTCWITINAKGVVVRDNGTASAAPGKGTGLASLESRWRNYGSFSARRVEKGWEVSAMLTSPSEDV